VNFGGVFRNPLNPGYLLLSVTVAEIDSGQNESSICKRQLPKDPLHNSGEDVAGKMPGVMQRVLEAAETVSYMVT